MLASRLIDAYSWQSLFYIGGVVPLVLSALLVPALPGGERRFRAADTCHLDENRRGCPSFPVPSTFGSTAALFILFVRSERDEPRGEGRDA